MQTPERKLFRLASIIHQQLVQFHQTRYQAVLSEVQHLLEYMESLQRWRKRMTICNSRHWSEAARKVAERLQPCLRDIPFYVGEIERAAEACNKPCPSVNDVFAEIRQLQVEFEHFEYDAKQKTLSVTTEAIEMENVYLGEFSIQLHIDRLSQVPRRRTVYRIVALDAHPATSNDSVTHPHVRDEELCAGDATAAIAAAMETGRICDFFLLVRSVLMTYNGHSPYVPLTEWSGRACNDCGYITDNHATMFPLGLEEVTWLSNNRIENAALIVVTDSPGICTDSLQYGIRFLTSTFKTIIVPVAILDLRTIEPGMSAAQHNCRTRQVHDAIADDGLDHPWLQVVYQELAKTLRLTNGRTPASVRR